MNTSAQTRGQAAAHAARAPRLDRRVIALGAIMTIVVASSLALLNDLHTGPTWLHWVGSLVLLATALGTVAIAELTWQRAITTATAAGLVEQPAHG
jgi:hypothetical protein